MIILGIETSCDETAMAVIRADGNRLEVLSSVVSSQVATHAPFGGVVPMLAAREHATNIGHVFARVLSEASISVSDVSSIAVTRGPGLGPALLVGLTFARTLSLQHDIPIVGVNHLDGHIHSNWLPPEPFREPSFPVLNVIVSGGHTELVLMRDHQDYTIIGETLDDAAGEAFDKVARLLGLPYPGGPEISRIAVSGNPTQYDLPRPMLTSDTLDFSYSGLKTAVLYLIRDLEASAPLTDHQRADIAASFQEAAIDVIAQKTRRAVEHHGVSAILLSGGVSANTALRERLSSLAADLNIAYAQPDLKWTGDNAAMIAAAGYYHQQHLRRDATWQAVEMDANLRLG